MKRPAKDLRRPAKDMRRPAKKSRRFAVLRDLAVQLVIRELKLRYRRSALGLAWAFALPAGQVLVLIFIFTVVLPTRIGHYSAFVSIGVLVWTWFQAAMIMSATAITGNRELVRRPGFPSDVLPLATVGTNLLLFLMSLPAMVIVVIWAGGQVGVGVVAVPIVIAVQFMLTLGLAYFVASLNVTLRDTQQVINLLLLLLFFLSPIFYDAASVPAAYRAVYDLNPFVAILEGYRATLLHGNIPNLLGLAEVAAVAIALTLVGHRLFQRASHRFAEEI
jgi:lipopolysaccharide transport system permease protein